MATQLVAAEGRLTFLRVHEVGSAFGPPTDQIDVEVVTGLDSTDERMGFQLRDDSNRPVRQGMLDLLRDAFNSSANTRLEYEIDRDAGDRNGIIIRVILQK